MYILNPITSKCIPFNDSNMFKIVWQLQSHICSKKVNCVTSKLVHPTMHPPLDCSTSFIKKLIESQIEHLHLANDTYYSRSLTTISICGKMNKRSYIENLLLKINGHPLSHFKNKTKAYFWLDIISKVSP